ncbi:DUF1016 N-terminal domain-containing protein [Streptomyces endophyticus]|uniref:DUF1016 N-terminal domain-containing protein n=1 Tax=Streptomyces endophyticus TaxID=714166 RepID=A0ABU6FHN7_9ACTN|nr:DUF1016 N-terminal domain-containing protein [Streptomyces endophyticus]MEB8343571.1 DUF1016 N-terminal domain-containing protein [Streptomyces endophyticus]
MARLAADLKTTFPNQRGFSRSNLMYMQQMARTWPDSIVQQPVGQLPWGHIALLMSRTKTAAERDFYVTEAAREGWSRDRLVRASRRDGPDAVKNSVRDPARAVHGPLRSGAGHIRRGPGLAGWRIRPSHCPRSRKRAPPVRDNEWHESVP